MESLEKKEFDLDEILKKISEDNDYINTMPDNEWLPFKQAVSDKSGIPKENIKGIDPSQQSPFVFQIRSKDGKKRVIIEFVDKKAEEQKIIALLAKLDSIKSNRGLEVMLKYINDMLDLGEINVPLDYLIDYIRKNLPTTELSDERNIDILLYAMSLIKKLEFKKFTS
jgi:hypothetical protein